MATRAQQLQILADIAEAINKAQALASVFSLSQVPLSGSRQDVALVTLTAAQKGQLGTDFDAQVAAVKGLAAGLP